MSRWIAYGAGLLTLAFMAATPAFAQQQPSQTQPTSAADCKAHAPQKVDGQVTRVDTNAGKITVKDKSGAMHEFQASKEMLQSMKAGDTIEATLREAPKC